MRKIICLLLTGLLAAGFLLTASAQEVGCTVSVGDGAALAGQTVTLPITIQGNPGVTNFALRLSYSADELELVSINTADAEENGYLCSALVAVNPHRTQPDGTEYGYAVCAMPETMTQDGVLLTVTFQIKEGFVGTASVTPTLEYMRTASEDGTAFTEQTAATASGSVASVLQGDMNGDGRITSLDAAIIYQHVMQGRALTDAKLLAADINGDGRITSLDAALLYRRVNNT